jgi:predicted Abi (CAAX) family protease
MRSRLLERLADVRAAVSTFPDAQTWLRCLVVYAGFLACALPLGFVSGFLRPEVATFPRSMFILLPLSLLLRPALVEELLFRALLLPRDTSRVGRMRLFVIATVALVVFVASHPLHGWLTRPDALGLFTSPIFLLFATLLGIACTLTYLISRSLWPPVLLHWITVVAWITLLGGQGVAGSRWQKSQRASGEETIAPPAPVVSTETDLAADVEQFAKRVRVMRH